jgi:hypothetical protein
MFGVDIPMNNFNRDPRCGQLLAGAMPHMGGNTWCPSHYIFA